MLGQLVHLADIHLALLGCLLLARRLALTSEDVQGLSDLGDDLTELREQLQREKGGCVAKSAKV